MSDSESGSTFSVMLGHVKDHVLRYVKETKDNLKDELFVRKIVWALVGVGLIVLHNYYPSTAFAALIVILYTASA